MDSIKLVGGPVEFGDLKTQDLASKAPENGGPSITMSGGTKNDLRPSQAAKQADPFDLATPIVGFPVRIGEVLIYVLMDWIYKSFEMKQLLAERDATAEFLPDGQSKITPGKSRKREEFFWAHFRGLVNIALSDGSEPSLEQQKSFVRRKRQIVGETVDALGTLRRTQKPKPAQNEKLLIDLEVERFVEVWRTLWLPSKQAEAPFYAKHVLCDPNQEELDLWDEATGGAITDSRRRSFKTARDYDAIERLYDLMIDSIEGVTVHGNPCAASNKSEWLLLVPFCHKLFVMVEFMGDVKSKND